MARLGFTYYDEPEAETPPTTQEILATVSGQDRGKILNGFAEKILPNRLKYNVDAPLAVIKYLYRKIDDVEQYAHSLMTGDNPPSTANALLTAIQDEFSDDFTPDQVEAVLQKMVQYSKSTKDGTWTFYKNNVT